MQLLPFDLLRSHSVHLAPVALFVCGVLSSLVSCSNGVIPGPGGGSDIFSTRKDLSGNQGGGSLGGAGGQTGLGGAGGEPGTSLPDDVATVCTPGVYFIDDLPECFVAEIASAPLSCDAPGRETLTEVREKRARQDECAFQGLSGSDCAALSVCGVVKVGTSAAGTCLTGATGTGFCVGPVQSECSASSGATLTVVGVRPEAEALQVYCAVEDRQ